MKTLEAILTNYPELAPLAAHNDVVDIKSYEGAVTLREFLAGMLSYYPVWIKALYGVRWVFVRFLGMKQEGMDLGLPLQPEKIAFERGEMVTFFETAHAKEDQYWFGFATDKHLTAYLGVIAEPLSETQRRFVVVTLVKYHHWTGPVYFNIIRPFHHLVVHRMARAGLAYRR